MEWIGIVCLGVLLCFSSYPKRVRMLEKKLKKIEKKSKGESDMSKLISGLVGKACKIEMSDGIFATGSSEIICDILDVDDEWIKIAYIDKKAGKTIKIIRIEDVSSVVEMGQQ